MYIMDRVPTELYTEFLFSIDDPDTLANFCKSNRMMRQLCKKYREKVCRKFVEKYQVDYNDENNFIYVANKVSKRDAFVDGQPDFVKIFLYYSKFFYEKSIDISADPDDLDDFEGVRERITSFPLYPNLEKLDCSFTTGLKKLPDGMTNLKTLLCNECKLESLPKGMVKLVELNCRSNKLIELPNDLFSVKVLNCSLNMITKLPETMLNLKHLNCRVNKISTLPKNICLNLTYLDCSATDIRKLPNGMSKCVGLLCTHNHLTELPDGMNNLTFLDCSFNNLVKLDKLTELPDKMFKLLLLNCKNNNLVSLPKNMVKLTMMDCSHNNLKALPNDMYKLQNLNCVGNDLQSFPYPTALTSLKNASCDREFHVRYEKFDYNAFDSAFHTAYKSLNSNLH